MGDSLPPLVGLGLVAVLLILNAAFVATEFSYVTARRTRIEQLARQGSVSANSVRRAQTHLDFYVAAAQLGITMASIALGWIGEPALAALIEPPVSTVVGLFAPAAAHAIAIAVAFALITGLHIVLGEFVPKSIALQRPDDTALALALPIELFVRVFRPAIWLLNASGFAILRLIGMNPRPLQDEPLAAEDLAFSLEASASAGLISRRELSLARHTLQLSKMTVRDLMVPRRDVVGIPLTASRDEMMRVFAEHRHTRYPVYRGGLDDVVGILDVRAVLLSEQGVLSEQGEGNDWRRHIQRPVILPESVSVDRALGEARKVGATLVILVDEYGGMAGVVSVFDVVEHLAGQLPDEFASEAPRLRLDADGTITLSGLVRLSDLEEELGLELPDLKAETVAGLVMERLGRVPSEGDEVRFDGHTARVLAMDRRRIERVLLIPRREGDRQPQVAREGDRER